MDDRTVTPTGTGGPWSRLAATGLVLAALGPLLMLAAGLLWGLEVSEEVPFFGITAAIGFIGAFLVLRFGTWAKIVGIIAALLMAMALFWTAFGLFTPGSFFDFVPGILVIPGALIAIISCIRALLARRAEAGVSGQGEPRAVRIVLTSVLVLAAVSAVLTFVTKSTVDAADATATVSLSDFEFDQDEYDFAGGSTVLVRNDDPFMHTFTIEELDVDIVLTPGSEKLVEIPSETGEYIVFCQPHTSDPEDPSEDDMAARVNIE